MMNETATNVLDSIDPVYKIFFKDSEKVDADNGSTEFFRLGDTDNVVKFAILGIAVPIMGFTGFIGNVLSIIVLTKARMRTPVARFLQFLAACDASVLATSTFLYGVPCFLAYIDLNTGVNYYARVGHFLLYASVFAIIAQMSSVYIIVAVSVERYLVVKHPIAARTYCSRKRNVYSSIAIIIVSILINLPHMFEYRLQEIYETDEFNATTHIGYLVVAEEFRKNYTYQIWYIYILYLLVTYVIPVSTLLVMNTSIYLTIRRANHDRKRLTGSNRQPGKVTFQSREVGGRKLRRNEKESSVTHMLLVVVGMAIICSAMPILVSIWQYVRGNTSLTPESEALLVFFFTLNSSSNFFIYVLYGRRFRNVFISTFVCSCCSCKDLDDFRKTSVMSGKFPKYSTIVSFGESCQQFNNLDSLTVGDSIGLLMTCQNSWLFQKEAIRGFQQYQTPSS